MSLPHNHNHHEDVLHSYPHTPAVTAQRLCVRFGDHQVLDHVSFAIPQGAVSAIIGPNGSGKTTLARAILGLQTIQEGRIELFGQTQKIATASIGYVPQYFQLDRSFPMTATEFLHITARPTPSDLSSIWSRIGLSTQVAQQLIGHLSGGQLQRLLIGQALLRKPDLLILDEPDANIDIAGERQIEDILKEYTHQGGTVILISHDISFVARAVQHVICLNNALVCSGPPHEALTQETLQRLFEHASLYHHH